MFKNFIVVVFALASSFAVYGQKTIYYSHNPKHIEVNEYEQTMLSFPVPPYAYSCNPSNVLEFQPVESLSDYDQMTLKLMRSDKKEADKIRTTEASTTARLLKLIPLKNNASTTCIVRLADGDVVNMNVNTTANIMIPGIDFQPLRDQPNATISVFDDANSIKIFRELLKGGNLSFLDEITPRRAFSYLRKNTENADYMVNYAATDGKNFTVWRISGVAKKTYELPRYFNVSLGQLYFSAYKSAKGKNSLPLLLSSGEKFYIYLMGSVSLTQNEVLGILQ